MNQDLLSLLQKLAPLRRSEEETPEALGWNAALDALVETLHGKVPFSSAISSLKVAPLIPSSLEDAEEQAAAARGWMEALEAASALS